MQIYLAVINIALGAILVAIVAGAAVYTNRFRFDHRYFVRLTVGRLLEDYSATELDDDAVRRYAAELYTRVAAQYGLPMSAVDAVSDGVASELHRLRERL